MKKNIQTWGAKFLLWSKYSNPRVSCRINCGGRVFICFSFSLSCSIYNSPECTGLVRYCPVHNIWGFGELNLICFWIKSVFQPDSIHYCYAYVLYGPQQILVSYEIPEGRRSVLFWKALKLPSNKIRITRVFKNISGWSTSKQRYCLFLWCPGRGDPEKQHQPWRNKVTDEVFQAGWIHPV